MRISRVDERMRKALVVIDGRSTIAEAIAAMKRARTPCLVVKPRWNGDAYGFLTAKDVVAKAVGAGPRRLNFSEHSVAEIMEKPAIVVGPELEIKYAVRLMTRYRTSGAVVVQNGVVAGTLMLEDVFTAL